MHNVVSGQLVLKNVGNRISKSIENQVLESLFIGFFSRFYFLSNKSPLPVKSQSQPPIENKSNFPVTRPQFRKVQWNWKFLYAIGPCSFAFLHLVLLHFFCSASERIFLPVHVLSFEVGLYFFSFLLKRIFFKRFFFKFPS